MNRRVAFIFAVGSAALAPSVVSCSACGSQAKKSDEAALVVGDRALLASDVELATSRVRNDAIAGLIDDELLAQEARRRGLDRITEVSAEVRSAERNALAQSLINDIMKHAEGETTLRARYDEMKREGKLTQRVIHVAHIVFHEGPDREAHTREALARLRRGEAFDVVAKEMSEDPTAQKGGALSPVAEGKIDRAFFDAAVALKAGETSEPVRSGYATHIIKALSDPEVKERSFDDMKEELRGKEMSRARSELLEKLRKETRIQRNDEPDGAKR